VPDRIGNQVSIERIDNRSIVSLKVSRSSLDSARERLRLAAPVSVSGTDTRSLWLGTDRWLLVSNSATPDVIIDSCKQALAGIHYNAVDYSAALAVFRLAGPAAARLLATGTGVDLRPGQFTVDTCCRTRFAQIAAVIVAESSGQFGVYVDRSYETYLSDWLAESSSICSSFAN